MKYSGMIFDFDGVICDTERFHYTAWSIVADFIGTDFTQEEYLPFQSMGREAVISYLAKKVGLTPDEKLFSDLSAVKKAEFARLTRTVGETDLIKGVKGFIIKARSVGYKTAVASSAKSAKSMLKYLSLDKYFDAIVDGNANLKKKPDPALFLAAAKKILLPPEECVVFEDSEAGVNGALGGGFDTIGIGQTLKNRSDITVFPDFTGVYEYFFK